MAAQALLRSALHGRPARGRRGQEDRRRRRGGGHRDHDVPRPLARRGPRPGRGARARVLEQLHRQLAFDPDSPHSVEEIDANTARVLNYASSHEGFAAQANLWFNPALLVAYEPRQVELRWVNERIVEVPYAFRALSGLDRGAKVLDVGATESTVCLSLATLGYDVTAVDPRPNPLSHERLQVVTARIEEWEARDAVRRGRLPLDDRAHRHGRLRPGPASDERLDLAGDGRMRELTPTGRSARADHRGERDSAPSARAAGSTTATGLDELLDGWDVSDLTLVQRRGATNWVDRRPADRGPGPRGRDGGDDHSDQDGRLITDPAPLRHPGAAEPVVGRAGHRSSRTRARTRARAQAAGARALVRAQPRAARHRVRSSNSAVTAASLVRRVRAPERGDLSRAVAARARVDRPPVAAEASLRGARGDAPRPDPGRLPRGEHARPGGPALLLGQARARFARPSAS